MCGCFQEDKLMTLATVELMRSWIKLERWPVLKKVEKEGRDDVKVEGSRREWMKVMKERRVGVICDDDDYFQHICIVLNYEEGAEVTRSCLKVSPVL